MNGGLTATHALLFGSPAIDAGNNCVIGNPPVPLTVDQRGMPRPVGLACDMGAHEVQPGSATISVVTATGVGTASFSTSDGLFFSLSAVAEADLPVTGGKPTVPFPFGFFSWTVTGVTASPITITMTMPSVVPAGTQY